LRILLVCEAFDAIGGIQEVVHRLAGHPACFGFRRSDSFAALARP